MNATLQKQLDILAVIESNEIFDSLTTFEKMELAIAIGSISTSTNYASTITSVLAIYYELDMAINGLSFFQKLIIAAKAKSNETGGTTTETPTTGQDGVAATGTLTIGGETDSDIAEGDIITIWKISLTAVAAETEAGDYEFNIADDKDEVIENILSAISLIPVASVLPFTAEAGTSPTITITAKNTGISGNLIETTVETEGTTAFEAATLEGGVDAIAATGGAIGSVAITGNTPFIKTNAGYEALAKASEITNFQNKAVLEEPVNAVAALKNLTFSDVAVDGDTVTIGTGDNERIYTFKTALSTEPAVPYEVLVEASAEGAVDNLIAAINAGEGAGTKYSTGTLIHPDVVATKSSTDTVVATAKTKGVAGNLIAIAQACTNATWADDALLLSGGVDGTVAVAGEIYIYDGNAYMALADNTISDSNFSKISFA